MILQDLKKFAVTRLSNSDHGKIENAQKTELCISTCLGEPTSCWKSITLAHLCHSTEKILFGYPATKSKRKQIYRHHLNVVCRQ